MTVQQGLSRSSAKGVASPGCCVLPPPSLVAGALIFGAVATPAFFEAGEEEAAASERSGQLLCRVSRSSSSFSSTFVGSPVMNGSLCRRRPTMPKYIILKDVLNLVNESRGSFFYGSVGAGRGLISFRVNNASVLYFLGGKESHNTKHFSFRFVTTYAYVEPQYCDKRCPRK